MNKCADNEITHQVHRFLNIKKSFRSLLFTLTSFNESEELNRISVTFKCNIKNGLSFGNIITIELDYKYDVNLKKFLTEVKNNNFLNGFKFDEIFDFVYIDSLTNLTIIDDVFDRNSSKDLDVSYVFEISNFEHFKFFLV